MNINSNELRKKFINFYRNYPGFEHQEVPSAPLVPSNEEQLEGKEKVLFTSAGMQPLIPYLTGKKDPSSKRLVNCQKCLRTDDIDEVGDLTHHTFFEMLGNWSIGDYWKKEAIEMSFKFLTEELEIPVEKLAVSVFAGDDDAPRDEESANEWIKLGIPEDRIFYFGKEHNWWPTSRKQPDGTLKDAFGPCGPDTEMFYWAGEGEPEGKPDTDTRWVEIWNDVFMQYDRKDDGILEVLPQRNVDTGMGLERTLAVLNGKVSAYDTDLFLDLYSELTEVVVKNFGQLNKVRRERVKKFLDYTRASLFLIEEGIKPGKNYQEAVLRRLIRYANDQLTILQNDVSHTKSEQWWEKAYLHFKEVYEGTYQFKPEVLDIIKEELREYGENISGNLQKVESLISTDLTASEYILTQNTQRYLGTSDVNNFIRTNNFTSLPSVAAGSVAFDAKSTIGFPIQGFPGTASIAEAKLGEEFSKEEFDKTANIFMQEHQKVSRPLSEKKFAGGLAGHSEIETKYHTATHLLHQALRDILGESVFQKGSNITPERLRFDFSFDRKMTDEEVKKTEKLVNRLIEEDLKVEKLMMSLEEAHKLKAIGLFNDKYAKEVSIYAIGPDYKLDPDAKDQRERGGYYSLEFCGGPHVLHTEEVGGIREPFLQIKITKEEAVSAGVRRIRAELV